MSSNPVTSPSTGDAVIPPSPSPIPDESTCAIVRAAIDSWITRNQASELTVSVNKASSKAVRAAGEGNWAAVARVIGEEYPSLVAKIPKRPKLPPCVLSRCDDKTLPSKWQGVRAVSDMRQRLRDKLNGQLSSLDSWIESWNEAKFRGQDRIDFMSDLWRDYITDDLEQIQQFSGSAGQMVGSS